MGTSLSRLEAAPTSNPTWLRPVWDFDIGFWYLFVFWCLDFVIFHLVRLVEKIAAYYPSNSLNSIRVFNRYPADSVSLMELTCQPVGLNSHIAVRFYLVPIHKRLFCPISALYSKFYPRNINYMPAVKFFACLDLDQNPSFLGGH